MKTWASVVPSAVVIATMVVATGSMAQTEKTMKADTAKAAAQTKQLKPQTSCPVTGETLTDKKYYLDYKGKRIYVCCADCLTALKKNPEKYLKKLEKMGQGIETIGDTLKKAGKEVKAAPSNTAEAGYWTCPMHPEIHQAGPGQCPICGMNLEFKKAEKDTMKANSKDQGKMKM
jgi:YHS domain-containing protein